MKLVLRRGQQVKQGFLGGNRGTSFSLYAQVRLEPKEAQLVEQFKIHDAILDTYEFRVRQRNEWTTDFQTITVENLLKGWERSEMGQDVTGLIAIERKIKEACQTFKHLLHLMEKFGGEEVIDIEAPQPPQRQPA